MKLNRRERETLHAGVKTLGLHERRQSRQSKHKAVGWRTVRTDTDGRSAARGWAAIDRSSAMCRRGAPNSASLSTPHDEASAGLPRLRTAS